MWYGTTATHWTAAGTLNPSPRLTTAQIRLNGADVSAVARRAGVEIRDVLNDAPNTARLVVGGGVVPGVGQPLVITMDDGNVVLFSGEVQAVELRHDAGRVDAPAYRIQAIDDTAAANRRRPFGTFVNLSATLIAEAIATTFAPDFARAIEAALPPVSITFDGSETLIAALVRLAGLVGGYAKIEQRTIALFTVDPGVPPDPVDAAHCIQADPPITITTDESQLRTRCYGKGYGENIPSDVLAGETVLPLVNGALFTPGGGQAILATTADGAQWQRIAYTSVDRPTGGTLVGPGAAPTTALALQLAAGAGVTTGLHELTVVYVTGSGKSLPGPVASITAGMLGAPATAPTPGTPTTGGQVDKGTHRYYAVFRTAAGKTIAGPASAPVTTSALVNPPTRIGNPFHHPDKPGGNLTPGATYQWRYSFRRISDGAMTAPSPISGTFGAITIPPNLGDIAYLPLGDCDAPPAGFLRQWWRTRPGDASFYRLPDLAFVDSHGETPPNGNPPSAMYDGNQDFPPGLGPEVLDPNYPGNPALITGTIPLSNIPIGPAMCTHVELYREFNNAGAVTARLAVTVTNGTTTASDTTSNAGLGAVVPLTNTATGNQIAVSNIPLGAATVTARELYMSLAGGGTRRLALVIANNTATTATITIADSALASAALEPAADTSGLQQPNGQVNAGSPTLLVASAGPFKSTGGWVRAGDQIIRYSGISAQTLTGIPATGPGAMVTAILYGQQATPIPALLGVTGITTAPARGSAVHVWVQRDDLAAQAVYGIVEYLIVDARRAEASLTTLCDAQLALYAWPLVTARYATRDVKTKSGKPVRVFDTYDLVIQDVTITQIDVMPQTPPRFVVLASSVRFSLEDTLRRLVAVTPTAERV